MKDKKVKLKEIANINMGQSPKGTSYNNKKLGMPFLQGNRTFGRIYPKIDTWTTEPNKIGKKNTILMSVRAPVGAINFADQDICIGRGLCSIEMKNGNNQYLYYVLMNSIQEIKRKSTGTVFEAIHRKELEEIELLNFDEKEQNKIANILFTIDKKIELNNQMNDNLHELAENIFHEIYQSGVESKLENLITSISIGSRPKGGAQNNGIPSIGAKKIEKFGKYNYHSEKYISEDFFNSLKKGIVKSGDVLLYKDGAYTGKVSMALNGFPHNKCAVNEHVFILNTKNNWAKFYLYFILNHHENKTKIFTMASSKAAQPGLNQMELKSLEVKLPSKDKIVAFEKKVTPIMNKIAYNAKENKILEQLRDIVLPKLINGEINLE